MDYKYKLSICMMVKDEEQNLKRCLESLSPLIKEADNFAELIIIDTGSIDNTPEIAKKYTEKLFFHQWNNNFSDMRNISISYATGEWIFIIDADERLDNPDKIIEKFKTTNLINYNTILLQVKNLYRLKDENNYNINVSPRIFRNDNTFKYIGSVHNQPLMKEPFINFDVTLTHYGYISNDKQLMEKKFVRTVALLKNELEINPTNIYYLYQLGVSYDMHGDSIEALYEFRKAYNLLKKENKKVKLNYLSIYGSYIKNAFKNKEYEEVKKIGSEALNLNKDYLDIYFILAMTAKQQSNYSELIKNCLEYYRLYNMFNSLDISKDLTIIMYHIDSQSKSFICYELSQYYLQQNILDKAYSYCTQIENKLQNIYTSVKILVKASDFAELKNYYIQISDDDIRDKFLTTLEEEIKNLSYDKKQMLFDALSDTEDKYGMFCKMRLQCKTNDVSFILDLLNKIDYDKDPLFYSEVFINFKEDKKILLHTFKLINIIKLRNIVKFLINKDKDFIKIFHDYILTENIRSTDLQGNKVFISIAVVLLLERIEHSEEIGEDYYNIFKLYVEKGINYVSQLYQIQKSRIIYNEITNDEDRFFILMNIVNESIEKNNIKLALKYLIESVKAFKYMAKYIDLFKAELLIHFSKGNQSLSNE